MQHGYILLISEIYMGKADIKCVKLRCILTIRQGCLLPNL